MATPKKTTPVNNHPMVISYNGYDPGSNPNGISTNSKLTPHREIQFQPPSFNEQFWLESEKMISAAIGKTETEKISKSIFVRSKDQIINLKLEDILWVEAYGDYVNFFTEKTRHIIHATMKAIESKLPINQFTRVHRSFIIRTDKIELIEESLIQIGKKLIPIGESYRNDFFSKLNIL